MLSSERGNVPAHPAWKARLEIREGRWRRPTGGLALGYAQANLIAVPEEHALEFIRFCLVNWAACPILEVLPAGSWAPRVTAAGADIRTDLPGYMVYRPGRPAEEVPHLLDVWRQDLVSVLIGCSFSVDRALLEAQVSIRHIEKGQADPTFVTTLRCRPTERIDTPLLVSMRPVSRDLVDRVTNITSRYVRAHGAPLPVQHPAELGIPDVAAPDFGEAVEISDGEVPLFWPCGLTALSAALALQPTMVVAHKASHMFVTDLHDEALTQMDAYQIGASPECTNRPGRESGARAGGECHG